MLRIRRRRKDRLDQGVADGMNAEMKLSWVLGNWSACLADAAKYFDDPVTVGYQLLRSLGEQSAYTVR